VRILIFNWRDLAHPAAGGAEVYISEVARGWVAEGHEVVLFCSVVPDRPTTEEIDGITVIRRGGRISVYGEARRFYEREAQGKFHLVIDSVNTRPFLCPSFVKDTPVIALIHQVAREVWSYEFHWSVAMVGRHVLEPRWLAWYRNVPTLTVSESSKASLHDYGLEDVSVLPEGWSPPDPLPVVEREARPTVLFVGRLAANKRPDHALNAFLEVAPNHPDARLWIAGTGPMKPELRRQANSQVVFFGRVSELEKYALYGRAHLLVVTSVREGWGMVVTEAASMGTPTLAYNVAGLRDSVTASGGQLVEPNIDALAAAMDDALKGSLAGRPVRPGGVASWEAVGATILEHAASLCSTE